MDRILTYLDVVAGLLVSVAAVTIISNNLNKRKDREMSTMDLALLLIKETQEALARGTKHYDREGRLLETPLEIIECLTREGSVVLVPAGEAPK